MNINNLGFLVGMLVLPSWLLSACDSKTRGKPWDGPQLSQTAVVVSDATLGLHVELVPRVLINGAWHGPTKDNKCALDGPELVCPAGAVGSTSVILDGHEIQLSFTAQTDVIVEAFSLEGPAVIPGATAWLSDGFQSWSQAGVLSIGEQADYSLLEAELLVRGDEEVVRKGDLLSWFSTFVGGGEASLVAGATTAERFKPWAQVFEDEDGLRLRLACGGTGERVLVSAGDSLAAEVWRVAVGEDLGAMLDEYGNSLDSRRKSHPAPAEAGWNSWYQLFAQVSEDDVRANAALASTMLAELMPQTSPPPRIVVDDGWQQAWGEWLPNDKFPSGIDGLTSDLKADGFSVGIWLAPLLVHQDSDLVAGHPTWFVRDVVWTHLENGPMRILDVTNPDAAQHLSEVIGRLRSWGVDLLKIDFLFAGTFEGTRTEQVTGMEAFHRAMTIIRQAAGDDVILIAVGAPGLPSFPYVDVWRQGHDIAWGSGGPHWSFIANQARTLAARWPYCRATLCDADPPLLRHLPHNEVEAGLWVVALAGGGLFLSDDLPQLPSERREWLPAELLHLSLSGEAARPVSPIPMDPPDELANIIGDLVSDSNHHILPLLWQLPDGSRLALNPHDQERNVAGVQVPAHSAVRIEGR